MTGAKILRLLKKNLLAPEIPEDLYMLIKKAVAVRKHLERNRKDKDSKFRLILIESRIHRLVRPPALSPPLPPSIHPTLPSLPSFASLFLRPLLSVLLRCYSHPSLLPSFPPSLPPGPLLPNDPQADPQLEVRVLHRRFLGGVNPSPYFEGGREGGRGVYLMVGLG